jgi:hypothetical protein
MAARRASSAVTISELSDHHSTRPAVASVLHQEESLAAWHDAHPESASL